LGFLALIFGRVVLLLLTAAVCVWCANTFCCFSLQCLMACGAFVPLVRWGSYVGSGPPFATYVLFYLTRLASRLVLRN